MDKAKKKIQDAIGGCSRYAEYRQAFAWAATPVFKKDNTLELKHNLSLDMLYQQTTKSLDDAGIVDTILEHVR